jgi:Ca-activated chloride channel homolog
MVVAQEPLQTLKVNVDIVQVYATVTDSHGRYVMDLKPEHFQVFEDNVEQKIEVFSSDDVPASIGIVFDVGGTMKPNLPLAREGALTFLRAGHLDNEYFVVEFNDKPELTEDFTRDLTILQRHQAFLPSKKEKAPLDALHFSLVKLKEAANARKILLVLTSGGYVTGQTRARDVRELARQLDAQLFAVDLPPDLDIRGEITDRVRTADIVEPLGGRSFTAGAVSDYINICRRISVAVRNQYAIAYRSTNAAHDGKYRKIRLKLNPPKGTPELFVQTRDGYYAAEP